MPTTYKAISTVTVGAAGAANIEFTSIPASYTDLKLILSGRSTDTYGNAYYDCYVQLNSNSGSTQVLYGTGSGVTAGVDASNVPIYGVTSSGATASTFGNAEVYIPNYTGTTNKTIGIDSVSENNATAANAQLGAGLITLTSAVTSFKITPYNSPTAKFAQYTTATLYGISKS